jgi:hypothetical protein
MQFIVIAAVLILNVPAVASVDWPAPSDTLALALLDSLQVSELDIELDEDLEVAGKQLWDLFATQELAKMYAAIDLPGGASVWHIFRSRLLDAASESGFEIGSLKRALDSIEESEPHLTTNGQLLPFGAFMAHYNGARAWVVPCRWESGYSPLRPVKAQHIRIWAFSVESGDQVGYITCK